MNVSLQTDCVSLSADRARLVDKEVTGQTINFKKCY